MANVGSEQIGGTLVQKRVLDRCEELAGQWYTVQTYRAALSEPDTPAMRFLNSLLREQGTRLIDRIFWLLGAIYGEHDTASIRRSLRSTEPRTRANALESLEAVGSRRLAELITPMFNALESSTLAQIAQEQRRVCPWWMLFDHLAALLIGRRRFGNHRIC
jgi:hypothetical protein